MDDDALPPIVLDCGSEMCRGGFGGEDYPRAIFRCRVGRKRRTSGIQLPFEPTAYVGDEARSAGRSVFDFNYPINNGIITDWEDMQKVCQWTVKKRKVANLGWPGLESYILQ